MLLIGVWRVLHLLTHQLAPTHSEWNPKLTERFFLWRLFTVVARAQNSSCFLLPAPCECIKVALVFRVISLHCRFKPHSPYPAFKILVLTSSSVKLQIRFNESLAACQARRWCIVAYFWQKILPPTWLEGWGSSCRALIGLLETRAHSWDSA
jgi:hypothetical protein